MLKVWLLNMKFPEDFCIAPLRRVLQLLCSQSMHSTMHNQWISQVFSSSSTNYHDLWFKSLRSSQVSNLIAEMGIQYSINDFAAQQEISSDKQIESNRIESEQICQIAPCVCHNNNSFWVKRLKCRSMSSPAKACRMW